MLKEFENEAGLAVHWMMMGANGRLNRPIEGGMLRHYTECNPVPEPSTKIIANLYHMKGLSINPHTVRFWYAQGFPEPCTSCYYLV